jgi:hypothetical protein
MTFGDMKETVETQMKKLKLSEHLIQDAVNILPTLDQENNLICFILNNDS